MFVLTHYLPKNHHCIQVAPWSKTGGLGDVCGSLPPALAARGHRVMVVAPQYQQYPEPSTTGVSSILHCFRLCQLASQSDSA